MFQMRYHQWKKDLFTGLMPSPQFGAVSEVNISFPLGDFSTSDDTWKAAPGYSITANDNIVASSAKNLGVVNSSYPISHTHLVSLGEQTAAFETFNEPIIKSLLAKVEH